jgi:hypothetical protein
LIAYAVTPAAGASFTVSANNPLALSRAGNGRVAPAAATVARPTR